MNPGAAINVKEGMTIAQHKGPRNNARKVGMTVQLAIREQCNFAKKIQSAITRCGRRVVVSTASG